MEPLDSHELFALQACLWVSLFRKSSARCNHGSFYSNNKNRYVYNNNAHTMCTSHYKIMVYLWSQSPREIFIGCWDFSCSLADSFNCILLCMYNLENLVMSNSSNDKHNSCIKYKSKKLTKRDK